MRRLSVLLAAALVLGACSEEPAGPPPVAAPSAPSHLDHHSHHSAGPAPSGAPGGTILVHAADELRPTLDVLVPKFEEGFPGAKVVIEWGAGPEHASHILDGMPVDVFVSADSAAIALVANRNVRGKPTVVARNPIVIAVPSRAADDIAGLSDLSGARVALCAETTRCGRTGRAALDAAAVPVLSSVEPDPAAALTRVRAGTADAALVQRSDLAAAGGDMQAVEFTQALRLADEFTAIRVTTGSNIVGGDAFMSFLSSSLARVVFAEAGLAPA